MRRHNESSSLRVVMLLLAQGKDYQKKLEKKDAESEKLEKINAREIDFLREKKSFRSPLACLRAMAPNQKSLVVC